MEWRAEGAPSPSRSFQAEDTYSQRHPGLRLTRPCQPTRLPSVSIRLQTDQEAVPDFLAVQYSKFQRHYLSVAMELA